MSNSYCWDSNIILNLLLSFLLLFTPIYAQIIYPNNGLAFFLYNSSIFKVRAVFPFESRLLVFLLVVLCRNWSCRPVRLLSPQKPSPLLRSRSFRQMLDFLKLLKTTKQEQPLYCISLVQCSWFLWQNTLFHYCVYLRVIEVHSILVMTYYCIYMICVRSIGAK